MKQKMIQFYMKFAEFTAEEMSVARRLKVGGVIVNNTGENIISFSWNGTPPGWDNNCEIELPDGTLKTKPEVIHAESNATGKVARSTQSSEGGYMFVTHSPCDKCAGSIIASGIKTVYFKNKYRDENGIDILRKTGISVIQLDSNYKPMS